MRLVSVPFPITEEHLVVGCFLLCLKTTTSKEDVESVSGSFSVIITFSTLDFPFSCCLAGDSVKQLVKISCKRLAFPTFVLSLPFCLERASAHALIGFSPRGISPVFAKHSPLIPPPYVSPNREKGDENRMWLLLLLLL